MNTDELRAALRYPDHGDAPDVAGIMAAGRRRRHRRRVGTGACVLLVAAIAAGTGIAASNAPGDVTAAAGVRTGAAPQRFDPLVPSLRLGPLPAGLDHTSMEAGIYRQEYRASRPDAAVDGPKVSGLLVEVLARGHTFGEFYAQTQNLAADPVREPTEPIDGREAWCLRTDPPAGPCAAIEWEYAKGGRARVLYDGGQPAANAAVARTVAESMSLVGSTPVRLPFRLTGTLASMRPASTLVDVYRVGAGPDGVVWNASVELVPDSAELDKPDGEQRRTSIGATGFLPGRPTKIGDDATLDVNTTVDGQPARATEYGLVVWGVRHTRAFVTLGDLDGSPIQYYVDTEWVPNPRRPVDWLPAR